MFPVTHLLRLILLLLVPLWLSLGAEALGLRLPFASVLSGWMHTRPPVDPALVPPPGWREATYLDANPDIAAAVRSGGLVSGYAHYVRYGRAEGRPGGLPDDRPPEAAPEAAPEKLAEKKLAERPQERPLERQALAETPKTETPKAEQTPAGGASATRTAPISAAPGVPPQPALPQTAPAQTAMARPAPEQAAPEQPSAPSPLTKPPPPASPPVAPPVAPPLTPLPAVKPAAPQAQEAPIQVSGLRTGSGSGSIRIVLDLDRTPRFETPANGRDGTLTVLLPGTVWKTSPTGRLPAAGWSYRAEPAGGGASRLIILGAEGGPATVKAIFAMPPEGDRSHRLVIDLAAPPNKAKPARTAAAEQKRT